MASGSKKRTLDVFFAPAAKKRSPSQPSQNAKDCAAPSPQDEEPATFSTHFAYPFPIQDLPKDLSEAIQWLPNRSALPLPKFLNNQPDLDLLYYDPYIPRSLAQDLFRFLRSSLPFYRVSYTINRGPVAANIVTPRFTTVFGLDATSRFDEDGRPVDAATRTQIKKESEYTAIKPRPVPQSLEVLRQVTQKATGCTYNFCLVNYYASGADSVAYHSDDERFLGKDPAIASLSLGAKRDFLLKHKPVNGVQPPGTEVLKIPLGSGDLVLMRGRTQANWLHSIPKRAGAAKEDGGRINITFRKAMVKGGTANYYQYNVGLGSVYRWDGERREMRIWEEREEREEVRIIRGPGGKVDPVRVGRGAEKAVVEEGKVKDEGYEVKTEGVLEENRAMWEEGQKLRIEEDVGLEVRTKKEGQAVTRAEPDDLWSEDDEAWEEKVRREVEGDG